MGDRGEIVMLGMVGTVRPLAQVLLDGAEPLDGTPELEALHPSGRGDPVPGPKDGPHAGAEVVYRLLQMLETLRSHRNLGQPRVNLLEQSTQGGELLNQLFLAHVTSPIMSGCQPSTVLLVPSAQGRGGANRADPETGPRRSAVPAHAGT